MVITEPACRQQQLPAVYRCRTPALSAALLLLAANATAAEWTVVPSFGVRELYSDNIDLAPPNVARSELVTELVPAIAVDATSMRFKLNAEYALHYFDYHRATSPSRTQHQANANANGEFVKDLLFADATANVSQQRISAFGPQSIDNANVTGNDAEVRTYSISPYVRHNFDDVALTELRYTRQKANMGGANLLDADTSRFNLDLHSGERFHRLGWGLKLDRQRVDYRNAPDVELGQYTGSLRLALTPQLSVNALAGYENNNYVSLGEDSSGPLWSVGVAWRPAETTSLAASAGHRFFGKTFNFSATHRAARTIWNVTYDEDVTTTSAARPGTTLDTAGFLNQLWATRMPDAAARQITIDDFIRNAGLPATLTANVYGLSNSVYLQKSFQASVALDGIKNTVVLRLFGTRREPLSTDAMPSALLPNLDNDSLQVGAAAVWSWHLSPRTDLDFEANYARVRSFANDRLDRDRSTRVGLTTKLRQKLSAKLEWHRQQRSSTDAGAAYHENAIALFVLMQF